MNTIVLRPVVKSLLHLPDGWEHLMRGTSVAAVLARLSGSKSDNLYQLSCNVEEIDDFVSHSWRASGWQKVACLTMLYNFVPAMLCSVGTALLVLVFSCLRALPVMSTQEHGRTGIHYELSAWCMIISPVVFVVVLLKWQTFLYFVSARSRTLFFDCICISQSDERLKELGIRSIAAFLAKSRRLVVLWSPDYFTRLVRL